jgi:RecA-family ATPase
MTDLPYSLDSEQSVLGTIIIDSQAIVKVKSLLLPEHFHIEMHERIYSGMVHLHGRGDKIDLITVIEETLKDGVFENQAEARGYLLKLAEQTIAPSSIVSYAGIITKNYNARQIIYAAEELKSGTVSVDEIKQKINNLPTSSPPITVRAADVQPKAIEWIMPNFIPRGMLSSLQGLPDVGKSFLTAAIAAAVTRDDFKLPSPDGSMANCVHGDVLILNSDDSPAYTTVPRLKSMGANLDRVHFESPDGVPLTFADERLPLLLKKINPVLVIFDPIQNYIGAKVDFHRVNEIHPVMRKLELLAETHNCAILCVQHISKAAASGKGGASVSWGLGSMGLNGIFRCVWTVGRVNDEEHPHR